MLVPDRLERIVVAFDGSPGSLAALEAGRSLAVRAGARLALLGVVAAPDRASALGELLDVAASGCGPHLAATWSVETGDPGERLRAACKATDLLTCGSRGRGPLLGALLGSVSSTLIADPPCPILLTPMRTRRSPGAGPLGVTTAAGR